MELNPTVPQDEFIFSGAKFPAFVGGFGSGKTEALINRCLLKKIQYPKLNVAFYEPTYDLIRMIAWPRFEEKLNELGCSYVLVKNPTNVITIEGYGQIIFRSMDSPQRIVGYQVADSFVDELDTMKRDDAAYAWRQIVARCRQVKTDSEVNTTAVATTPEGFRFVYEQWEQRKREGYELYRAPTRSNPYLPADYIDGLKATYPEHLLEAYLEGQFVNLTSGTVYGSFVRATHHSDDVVTGKESLHIGLDFNVGNMSAVVHVLRDNCPIAVDELTGGLDTPEMITTLQARFVGHQIYIYPDASGAGRRSNNAQESDIYLLKKAGFKVIAPKKNPPVRDRVNAMNSAFSSKGYKVNTLTCPSLTRCYEQQAYDKNGDPDKSQGLDHLPDAAGYFISQQFPLIKPAMTISMRTAF